jgi:hypothetical protein
MSDNLEPAEPDTFDVPEETPRLAQIEPARLLAAEAGARLRRDGFSDEQIREWADTYVVEHRGGDVESFVNWIKEREQAAS